MHSGHTLAHAPTHPPTHSFRGVLPAGAGAGNPQQGALLAMYGAYLVIPLLIALTMAASRIPFPAAKKKKVA